jgi:hypothetical protein
VGAVSDALGQKLFVGVEICLGTRLFTELQPWSGDERQTGARKRGPVGSKMSMGRIGFIYLNL